MLGFFANGVGKGLSTSEAQSMGLKASPLLLDQQLLCARYCDRHWRYKAEVNVVCSSLEQIRKPGWQECTFPDGQTGLQR